MKITLTADNLVDIMGEYQYPTRLQSIDDTHVVQQTATYKGNTVSQGEQFCFDKIMVQRGGYTTEEPLTIIAKGDRPMLGMHFNLQGRFQESIKGFKSTVSYQGGEHMIGYVPEPETRFHYESNAHSEGVGVLLETAYFERFSDQNCKMVDQLLEAIHKQSAFRTPVGGVMSPLMKNTVCEMVKNPFSGLTKRLFMEAKVLELLSLQIDCYDKDQHKEYNRSRLLLEREKLFYAKDLLEKHFQNPPTIYELSKLIGLNEFKLKTGFKALFGNTIFSYLSDHRLSYARQFLLETDKSVAEISEMIGYSQPQHFATAFKRRYGVPPSKVRTTAH
ncbi:MAG: AraC family transcriptional regulator [Bacteroidota bacterium]